MENVVDDIYGELKKKRPVDGRALIRVHLDIAARSPRPPTHLTERHQAKRAKLANRIHDDLVKLRQYINRDGDPDHILDPGSVIFRALLRWSITADPRIDWKQQVAAAHALAIITECSFDRLSTAESGNLHNVMRLVHEHVYGPLVGEAAGIEACRRVLAWHRKASEAISSNSTEIA